jgi:hypothetical protein
MADWNNYKNQGPWDFTKQPNKWAYLNNKRWSDIPEAVEFSLDRRYPIDPTYAHDPCGHWHTPEIIPGQGGSFPVGRLLGWDSIYSNSYAFGWDEDYAQLVKIDLTTLNAIDYVSIDPGFGNDTGNYQAYLGFRYQCIDACDKYLYLFFTGDSHSTIWRIFKIEIATMSLITTGEFTRYGSGDIFSACADMQWIYMTIGLGGGIYIIPTSLDNSIYNTSVSVPAMQGENMGVVPGPWDRSIKVDPYNDMLIVSGVYGAEFLNIEDLSQRYYGPPEEWWVAQNDWSKHIQWIPKLGIGYYHQGYHPWDPRCYLLPDTTPIELSDSDTGYSDWSDCAFYQAFRYFYRLSPEDKNGIDRISFSGSVSTVYFYTSDGITPRLPGLELAADKKNCKPVLKSINNYASYPNPDPLGTFLSRFDDNLNVEEYRHLVTGYKVLVEPVDIMTLEPQVWRY